MSYVAYIGKHRPRHRLPNGYLICTARRQSSLNPTRPRASLFTGNTNSARKYQEWLRRKRAGK